MAGFGKTIQLLTKPQYFRTFSTRPLIFAAQKWKETRRDVTCSQNRTIFALKQVI